MKNEQIVNQLRYWRNTLVDAARVEIPVEKLLSIRNGKIDFRLGQIDQKQANDLIDLVERQCVQKRQFTTRSRTVVPRYTGPRVIKAGVGSPVGLE